MIVREWQHTARCDICGKSDALAYSTKGEFVRMLRQEGWKVFNTGKAFCPECKARRDKE